MSSRYRMAQAMGTYEEVVREDENLLAGFGLRLLSVQCGIRAAVEDELKGGRVNPWNVLTIDEKTWGWMRPLLVRLRDTEQPLPAGVIPLRHAEALVAK